VNTTITVREYDEQIPISVYQGFQKVFNPIWELFFSEASANRRAQRLEGQPISILTCLKIWENNATAGLVFYGGTMLFGGVHVGGWNFFFPTKVDRILWRCASVYTIAISPVMLLCMTVEMFLHVSFNIGGYRDSREDRKWRSLPGLSGIYVLARLVILVETFRTLVFLPVDAFASTWTANVPHFS
jgi:hypothetical protein